MLRAISIAVVLALAAMAAYELRYNVTAEEVVAFVKANQSWAPGISFILAFGESLAFISLILPATVILASIAGLLGSAGVAPETIVGTWLAAGIGGALGYAVSYWLGLLFKDDIQAMWPFTSYPKMLADGRAFFARWGTAGVFLGHFFGPVRAVVPVVAGMLAMRHRLFQLLNVSSSMLWSTGILLGPYFFARLLAH